MAPALAGMAVSAMPVPPATRVRAASIAVLVRLMSAEFLLLGKDVPVSRSVGTGRSGSEGAQAVAQPGAVRGG
ncbi:hypothetical protein ACE1SV_08160 [Streptomyces sennicomposti]